MQIAQSALSALCKATGVVKLSDTAQLHNRPLNIRVKIRPASGDYEAGNALAGYETAGPAAAPAAAPAKPAAAPWAKAAQAV